MIFLVSFRFVSALYCFVSVVSRFVSFLLVSFRFVSVSFLVLQSPVPYEGYSRNASCSLILRYTFYF